MRRHYFALFGGKKFTLIFDVAIAIVVDTIHNILTIHDPFPIRKRISWIIKWCSIQFAIAIGVVFLGNEAGFAKSWNHTANRNPCQLAIVLTAFVYFSGSNAALSEFIEADVDSVVTYRPGTDFILYLYRDGVFYVIVASIPYLIHQAVETNGQVVDVPFGQLTIYRADQYLAIAAYWWFLSGIIVGCGVRPDVCTPLKSRAKIGHNRRQNF